MTRSGKRFDPFWEEVIITPKPKPIIHTASVAFYRELSTGRVMFYFKTPYTAPKRDGWSRITDWIEVSAEELEIKS